MPRQCQREVDTFACPTVLVKALRYSVRELAVCDASPVFDVDKTLLN